MDNARQQIVDSIKNSSNILVTVSSNPSVDELSASLGLAIILNNIDKRATAIFSGAVPPAITFLEPEKTFENTADSLRDFIIALNKEKADHLRYKVEGDHVKIFITPYRTTLAQTDLEFSQGDYNVELVIALGVKDQAHLDKAIEAHGKILHDAKVVTVTAGTDASSLGSLDWREDTASSLSEMIVGLADGLKGEQSLLDNQISTALLTGIVSATDRFSNDRTSSRTMTVAAQLMAAGANQQLIAAKLEEAHDIAPGPAPKSNGLVPIDEKEESGTKLTIDRTKTTEELVKESTSEAKIEPAAVFESDVQHVSAGTDEEAVQQDFEKRLNDLAVPVTGTLADIENELKLAAEKSDGSADTLTSTSDMTIPEMGPTQSVTSADSAPESVPDVVPELSSTPIETTAPAVEEKTSDNSSSLNIPPEAVLPVEETSAPPEIIKDHGTMAPQFDMSPAFNSVQSSPNEGEPPTVDPFVESTNPGAAIEQDMTSMKVEPMLAPPNTTIGTPQGAALLASDPEKPVWEPKVAMPQLPPLPSANSLPPLPLPPPPPPPVFHPGGTIPPGAVSGDIFGDGSTTPPNPNLPATPPPEPGQFRIPGSPS